MIPELFLFFRSSLLELEVSAKLYQFKIFITTFQKHALCSLALDGAQYNAFVKEFKFMSKAIDQRNHVGGL